MNISSSIKTVKSVITANSPVLLMGTALAGVVTTGILAAKAGYKARGIVDAEQARRNEAALELANGAVEAEPLSLQEKVQLTWLCYAVPAVTGASTIAATVGMHTIHTKRANAMAALYAVTSNKLDDYGQEAEKLLGAKKTQALNDEVAQKAIDRREPLVDNAVIITGRGDELCHDDWSGQWFRGSVANIEAAVNEINRKLIDQGEVSLNEFYELVGIKDIQMGERFGWNGADKVEVRFGNATTPDARPAIAFWFQHPPKDNLGRY